MDEEMFDFDEPEGAMTMTIDPATHYAEQAALAALLKWCESREAFRNGTTGPNWPLVETSDRLYAAGAELRRLYEADKL